MPEWFKGPVLKTGVRKRTVGSNPSPSGLAIWAIYTRFHFLPFIALMFVRVPVTAFLVYSNCKSSVFLELVLLKKWTFRYDSVAQKIPIIGKPNHSTCPIFMIQRFPPFGKRFFKRIRKLIGSCHFSHFWRVVVAISSLTDRKSLSKMTKLFGERLKHLERLAEG